MPSFRFLAAVVIALSLPLAALAFSTHGKLHPQQPQEDADPYWTLAEATREFVDKSILTPYASYAWSKTDWGGTDTWHDVSQIYADAAMLRLNRSDHARYLSYINNTFDFMHYFLGDGPSNDGYWSRASINGSGVSKTEKYIDDNSLAGVSYLDAAEAVAGFDAELQEQLVAQARAQAHFLMHTTAWDYWGGGGFYWNTGTLDHFKYTQSNGLALQLFLRLYALTGDSRYHIWASAIKSFLDTNNFDADLGVYVWCPGDGGQHVFTYDNAIMIDAHLDLYSLTGEEQYLQAAQSLAGNMTRILFQQGAYLIHSNATDGGHRFSPTFGGWATQSLVRLAQTGGQRQWLFLAQKNVDTLNWLLRDLTDGGYRSSCAPDGSAPDNTKAAVDQAWMQRVQALLASATENMAKRDAAAAAPEDN